MAFDYKKEYKNLYSTSNKPTIIDVPDINYISVSGKGNPNDKNGEYKESIDLLYTIAYTIKMSYKNNHRINGFFDFVVPPLEGLWWQDYTHSFDYNRKNDMNFISLIRLPDFVSKEDLEWAIKEATYKKNKNYSKIKFITLKEGLCLQCMHTGSYDDEPCTIQKMNEFIIDNGYTYDISDKRFHHEIYLSNPNRCKIENLKTIIRLPIKKD